MELIDPRSGQVVWADSWGAPMPPPRADGLAYIERGARTDRTVPPEDINALAMIGRETGITPRLNALNQMLNPVNSLYEAGQHSKNMLAPGRTGWERVGDLGGMLSGMAGTVAPMWAGAKGAIPAADAVMEGVAGFSAMPRAVAGEFMADEFGGMKLYHGSPHDFDKFSMDKIGTGTGEQAFGPGMYFSESEDVAKAYRDKLSIGNVDIGTPEGFADAVAEQWGAKEAAKRLAALPATEFNAAALARIKNRKTQKVGHMYEADVNANADDFFDYDAFPESQTEAGKRFIESQLGAVPDNSGAVIMAHLSSKAARAGKGEGPTSGVHPATVDEMKAAGIPGIKFKREGARNYVVFDENLISIVRKYGIAGAAAMLGLSTMDVERAIAGQRE